LRALLDVPAAFGSTHSEATGLPDEEWEQRAGLAAAGAEQAIFVIEDGSVWLGMAGLYLPPDDPARRHMWGVWVDPQHRGRGWGEALVVAGCDWAADAGAWAVTLWVAEGNLPALRLYARLGFSPTGNRKPLPSDPSTLQMQLERGVP
jgi:ribosomal protein S18 acetylase RimI-like enzyme